MRDDIIRMAREACVNLSDRQAVGRDLWYWPMEYQEKLAYRQALERFADLVAAAEREACAQEAEAEASIEGIGQRIAAAIRARGNT